ncbi:hypothetical protein SINU_07865 [Sporolactobacillus inulinus CASD]|uniref:Uncharacterized protein n=1 Tax=Sporolactobacillus inulinus CASD TaxID=1069536 RepID=A0A0U1QNV0_9BACL|nr:hypothetical protein SINU_07865 [Sporolactobacillus inulinus CASD]
MNEVRFLFAQKCQKPPLHLDALAPAGSRASEQSELHKNQDGLSTKHSLVFLIAACGIGDFIPRLQLRDGP